MHSLRAKFSLKMLVSALTTVGDDLLNKGVAFAFKWCLSVSMGYHGGIFCRC